jgi:subtilisin-like proprotein convertase family protein
LIAPDGTKITLFSGVGGTGSNFVNTIFDDSALNPIASGTAPFTGTFKPTGTLSTFGGHTVDFKNTANQWVPGVWTLQLTNSKTGVTGTLGSWSLNITPVITVTPVNAVDGNATQFTIGFPQQQLSGTYTIQLGTGILDTFNQAPDVNGNAGLDVLRGQSQNGSTTPALYKAGDLPRPIPAPTGSTPGQVTSTISVPDDFIIQGDSTTAGVSGLQVQINLTYPFDPDLAATLNHYDSNGNLLGSVPLFSNVGSGTNTANFTNTLFDDNAGTPIQIGSAPFFATFTPQKSLASTFAGMNAKGTWTLVIQNTSTTKGTGTFNGWSLTFQKPLSTTGLGEPGSDDASASFRIFRLAQNDPLSSQSWTAVGPGAIGSGAGGGSGESSASGASGRVSGLAIDPSDPSGNTVYAAGASGGVWKTTNFLTTAPGGPTWIPLTDFGPTNTVNIGGLAVFPRNNDPNQSIIIAAAGEGDTGTPGVGFLISKDGGPPGTSTTAPTTSIPPATCCPSRRRRETGPSSARRPSRSSSTPSSRLAAR